MSRFFGRRRVRWPSLLLFGVLGLLSSCSSDDGTNAGADASDTEDDAGTAATDPEIEWATIPAGSFTFGSPVDTPCRGAVTETEVPVTLTRAFLISKYEITQKQWKALGFDVPPNAPLCEDCPITFIDFYEAAAWCNALSALEGLEQCYRLEDCTGTIGSGCPDGDWYKNGCLFVQQSSPPTLVDGLYRCPGNLRRYESMYDCKGYRLPTDPEWEYAAKAGTTTNTYNGDITFDSNGGCVDEPILNDIAWYCHNTGAIEENISPDQLHEVGLKQPNPWGLYDMIGNASEWADCRGTGNALGYSTDGEPLVDPMAEPLTGEGDESVSSRGSGFGSIACLAHAAWRAPWTSCGRNADDGFRPVRTLPATSADAGAK